MPSEVIYLRIRTLLKPLSFLPAILLMYMIFSFSAQEGEVSSTVSYKASYIIVDTADHIFDMGMDDYQISYFATKINGVTRKLAHMTEYFLLAISVSFPLYVYGLHGILLMILAGGFCIAFACGDEYHQSYVAGRAASMKDVGIDSVGVFIGIILVRIIGWTGRKTIFRPRKEEYEPQLTRKEKKRLKAMQQEYSQPQSYGQYPSHTDNRSRTTRLSHTDNRSRTTRLSHTDNRSRTISRSRTARPSYTGSRSHRNIWESRSTPPMSYQKICHFPTSLSQKNNRTRMQFDFLSTRKGSGFMLLHVNRNPLKPLFLCDTDKFFLRNFFRICF